MTELEKINALRYIYGFSFRALDKKVSEPIPYRIMSVREVNRMEKQRQRQAQLWKMGARVNSYARGK